ncbi:pyridoxamine 5'-phosphate oxidase family protein [Paenibacillus sp. WQ 127069]|uniref:Pyridoxamine 5'-phosphate oxidase family protein n=1 Tax=Paenibacillus baimaensis TaxID=2982185 RepID=A0ABT2UPQ7_9BACL|nr:pyridoxamine 5'-phosphate oxidase family protein [Paenibacillus sp. WQ 127069]MCU6796628.1 pyridoxamine 5'-phosphate oxidase family protein [Paenibacillus sp. WQ 127069]
MRRKEFEVMDHEETLQFLQEVSFGVLGSNGEDGWPQLTPLNFVYYEGCLYFHGSHVGQKMKNLKSDTRVTFSVAKEYAIIPSYWSDTKLACPATAFFKSVLIKGHAELVSDLQQKAAALSAFMQKLQSEGGYEQIDPLDTDYIPQLKATSVVRIVISEMSAKFKFGQNMQQDRLEQITTGLVERNLELDTETATLMKAYCPHHRKQS